MKQINLEAIPGRLSCHYGRSVVTEFNMQRLNAQLQTDHGWERLNLGSSVEVRSTGPTITPTASFFIDFNLPRARAQHRRALGEELLGSPSGRQSLDKSHADISRLLPSRMLRSRLCSGPISARWQSRFPRTKPRCQILHRIRPFHQSTSNEVDAQLVLDLSLLLSHQALIELHSLGFSWAAVIPITAITLRTLVYLPLLAIPDRHATQRFMDIQPIVQAYAKVAAIEVEKSPEARDSSTKRRLRDRGIRKFRSFLAENYSCGLVYRCRSVLQIPIFLLFAESLRRMVGTHSTLLGLLADRISPRAKDQIDSTREMVMQDLQDPWLEPSMANEGFLWFQDLTLADPTLTLPFVVSAVTFANIYYTPKPRTSTYSFQSRVLRRILLAGALAIGPLTLRVPSAIMLFWLSGTVGAACQTAFLHWKLPLKAPPVSCKRPVSR